MPYLFFPCHFDRREKSFLDPSLSFGMTNGLLGVEILFQGGMRGKRPRAMRRQVRGLNAFVIKR